MVIPPEDRRPSDTGDDGFYKDDDLYEDAGEGRGVIGWLFFFALCLFVGGMVAWWASPAWPHTAASGWAYDSECCSGVDCYPVEMGVVTPTPEGWMVRVSPETHPLATSTAVHVKAYDDPDVRRSGDSDFHVCIRPYTQEVLCIYVPDQLG